MADSDHEMEVVAVPETSAQTEADREFDWVLVRLEELSVDVARRPRLEKLWTARYRDRWSELVRIR